MRRSRPTGVGWKFFALVAGAGIGTAAVAMAADAPPAPAASSELAPPVQIFAGDKPIDTDIGHAAPFFGDINGDGKSELLVGQFGEGKLRIYTNIGTKQEPKFDDHFAWFQADRQDGKVPAS